METGQGEFGSSFQTRLLKLAFVLATVLGIRNFPWLRHGCRAPCTAGQLGTATLGQGGNHKEKGQGSLPNH